MGCAYSSPRDEPTLRRSVWDVSVRQRASGGGPLPGQARHGGARRAPRRADRQSGGPPGGRTRFMGPPVSWVPVCTLRSLLPKEGIWTGTQQGPSCQLPDLGKGGLRVHSPVWSCPAGSGRLRALRCGPTWTEQVSSAALSLAAGLCGGPGGGQALLLPGAMCNRWEHQQTAPSCVRAVTRDTGSSRVSSAFPFSPCSTAAPDLWKPPPEPRGEGGSVPAFPGLKLLEEPVLASGGAHSSRENFPAAREGSPSYPPSNVPNKTCQARPPAPGPHIPGPTFQTTSLEFPPHACVGGCAPWGGSQAPLGGHS